MSLQQRGLARDLYLPMPFVEALGRGAVALSELELSFDILIAILASEPGRHSVCYPRDPFETKIEYLATISRSRLLKHQSWRILRRTAAHAKMLKKQYSSAALGSIYSRGPGLLEEIMRPLAEKTNVAPPRLSMTAAKIDRVAEECTRLASVACELAESLIKAAENLSISIFADRGDTSSAKMVPK